MEREGEREEARERGERGRESDKERQRDGVIERESETRDGDRDCESGGKRERENERAGEQDREKERDIEYAWTLSAVGQKHCSSSQRSKQTAGNQTAPS